MDLTTLERVRRLVGFRDPDDVSADAILAQLITEVSADVERALDRDVQSGVSRTEHFSPRAGQRVFPLRAWPNASITSVVEALDRDWTNGSTVPATDYVVDDTGLLVIDGWSVSPGVRSLRVIHTGGMAATATAFALAFPDLALGVEHQVVFLYRKRDSLGLQALTMEGVSAQFAFADRVEMQPILRDAIRRHRREVALG